MNHEPSATVNPESSASSTTVSDNGSFRSLVAAQWLTILLFAAAFGWWVLTRRMDTAKALLTCVAALGGVTWMTLRWRSAMPMATLFAATGLGLYLATDMAEGQARIEGWMPWIVAAAAFAIAKMADPGRVARSMVWLAGALALLTWIEALGIPPFMGDGPPSATFDGPAPLGIWLALTLPWLCFDDDELATSRGSWSVALGLIVGAIFLTGNRAAWLVLLGVLPFALRGREKREILWGLVPALGLVLLVDLLVYNGDLVTARLSPESVRAAANVRLAVLSAIVGGIEDVGFLGLGPESFARIWPLLDESLANQRETLPAGHDLWTASSDPLQLFVETGLIGFSVVLAIAVVAFRAGDGSRGRRAAGVALIGVALASCANTVVYDPALALLAGIILGQRFYDGGATTSLPVQARVAGGVLVMCALVTTIVCFWPRIVSEVHRNESIRSVMVGDYPAALDESRLATEADARSGRAWITRGVMCKKARDFDCSLAAFERATDEHPSLAIQGQIVRLRIAIARKR